jgi:hypothetical protein
LYCVAPRTLPPGGGSITPHFQLRSCMHICVLCLYMHTCVFIGVCVCVCMDIFVLSLECVSRVYYLFSYYFSAFASQGPARHGLGFREKSWNK